MSQELKEKLKQGIYDKIIGEIYVDEKLIPYNRDRYIKTIEAFEKNFGVKQVEIYSAPGRSEVCGNHTDHQNGMVLATSINLDAIAVVAKTKDNVIHLISDGFSLVEIDLDNLSINEEERNTTASLIRGVAAGFKNNGYAVGGFEAYVSSDVLVGAGMSSSAAFESLVGTILSFLYNDGKISMIDIAKIGQFSENKYFGKPCGLMDQMACSVGGMIYIDFKDNDKPIVKQAKCDFAKAGLSLCIVDTKGSHADLTPDYAAIPGEMNQVARALGKEHLREVEETYFYENIAKLRDKVSDRAILRAIHFYEEEKRVEKAFLALDNDNYNEFLQVIKDSGNSSAKYLQNIYSSRNTDEQNVTVALAVTESILKGMGASRIHGGGFAGTIQAFVENEFVDTYKECIEKIYGENSCHVLKIRPIGGMKVL